MGMTDRRLAVAAWLRTMPDVHGPQLHPTMSFPRGCFTPGRPAGFPSLIRHGIGPVFLLGLLFSGPLRAQDVTVGEAVWALPGAAPEEMPKQKSRLRPDYPKELRAPGEIGYVVIQRYVGASGESRSLRAIGTQTPFQRAVETEFGGWEMKPARRNSQPVDAAIWLPVIFNPGSASAKGEDTTPRLLAVTPVYVPLRPTSRETPPVVRMHLSLDATGAITAAIPETPLKGDLAEAITTALQGWKFAPARRAGHPIATELVMPVLCEPPLRAEAAQHVPPKALKRSEPDYPYAMRRFRLEGRVQIEFVVDTTGKPQNPVISESSNPAFDEPALAALREWTFQPATVDGRPVKARLRQEIRFHMNEGGDEPFSIQKTDQAKIPEEWRHDTEPKIRGVQLPVYPYALRAADVRGTAQATMIIDPTGRVVAVAGIKADRPEFGQALAAALEGFQFDPALRAGKPVKSLLKFEQKFNSRELGDEPGDWLLADEKKHPERIVSAAKLDSPLKPVSRRAPIFPVTVAEGVTSGTAMIEFLIGKDGHVRLPRIVDATDPAFGYAAVQAAATWWFEPPTVQGKEVVVRVRIPIEFNVHPNQAK